MNTSSTIAVIPARGGSKGVPGKNIRPLCGYPIIAYTIHVAKQCKNIDRVIVSTDSPEIAEIASAYGAEIPFMRPSKLAGDTSPDRDFIIHALDWLREHENHEPELLVHLRPTTPLREAKLVDEAVQAIRNRVDATSLRSAHELAEPPQKMLGIEEGFFTGLFPHDHRPEYYNLPRQLFPQAYHPNGYVDIWRTSFVRSGQSLAGDRVLAFETPFTIEIDRNEDLEFLDFSISKHGENLYSQLCRDFPAIKKKSLI